MIKRFECSIDVGQMLTHVPDGFNFGFSWHIKTYGIQVELWIDTNRNW